MKIIYVLLAMSLLACNVKAPQHETSTDSDTIAVVPNTELTDTTETTPASKTYSNARFKDVTVERIGEHQFLVRGKGQIFEANFGWVVEDGHNEIKEGFQMTDAGAPEWGNFSFTVDVAKQRENSTLTLILYESSPKDGSRQHELPVFLY